MEQKKRGRPPKIAPPIHKKAPPTRDAVLKIHLDMPDFESSDFEIVIPNIKGKLLGSQRNPEVFIELIKSKLRF